MYKLEERERELYCLVFKTLFDRILDSTVYGVKPVFISGGSCRRYDLLLNGHDIDETDLKNIFNSDIDVYSATYSYVHANIDNTNGFSRNNYLNSTSNETQMSPFLTYGLFEVQLCVGYGSTGIVKTVSNKLFKTQHVLADIKPYLDELTPYRQKLFNDDSVDAFIEVLTGMYVQYIAISKLNTADADCVDEIVIQKFDLKFDLNSSFYVYWNGKLYDKRPFKFEDPHNDTIVNLRTLKTIARSIKLESYGYRFSNSNIQTCFNEMLQNICAVEDSANSSDKFTLATHSEIHDLEYGNSEIDMFGEGL